MKIRALVKNGYFLCQSFSLKRTLPLLEELALHCEKTCSFFYVYLESGPINTSVALGYAYD